VFPKKSTQQRHGWPRVKRWFLRTSAILVGGSLVCAIGLFLLVHNLDKPSVSQPLKNYLLHSQGIKLEYDSLSVSSFSQIRGTNLRIATPAPFHTFAPNLLEIGQMHVHWTPTSAASALIQVDQILLTDVTLTVVMDTQGNTSLDGFSDQSAPTPSPAPVMPISGLLSALPGGLSLASVRIDGLSVVLVTVDQGQLVARKSLSGLTLSVGGLLKGVDTALKIGLSSSSEGNQALELTSSTWTEGVEQLQRAECSLNLLAEVEDQTLTLHTQASLLASRGFDPPLPTGELLSADIRVAFSPDAGHIQIHSEHLRGAWGTIDGRLGITLADQPEGRFTTTLEQLSLTTTLEPILPLLELPEGVHISGAQGHLQVQGLELSADDFLPHSGRVRLDAQLALTTPELALKALDLQLTGELVGPMAMALEVQLPLSGLTFQDEGEQLSVAAASLHLTSDGLSIPVDAPAQVEGPLEVQLELQDLVYQSPSLRLDPTDLTIALETLLVEGSPSSLLVNLTGEKGQFQHEQQGWAVPLDGLNSTLTIPKLRLNLAEPGQILGQGNLTAGLRDIAVGIDFDKRRTSLQYVLELDAPRLAPLVGLLEKVAGPEVVWKRLGLHLTSQGLMDGLDSLSTQTLQDTAPRLDGTYDLGLTDVQLAAAAHRLAMPALSFSGSFQGDASAGDLRLELAARRVSLDGKPLLEGFRTKGLTRFDLSKPGLQLDLRLNSRVGPEGRVQARVALDKGHRVDFQAGVWLERFPGLAGVLSALDLGDSPLKGAGPHVVVSARGKLSGLLGPPGEDGLPVLVGAPERTVSGPVTVDLELDGLDYGVGALKLAAEGVKAHGVGQLDGGAIHGTLSLNAARLAYCNGPDRVEARGLVQTLAVTSRGPLVDGTLSLSSTASLETLEHSFFDPLPTGDWKLGLALQVEQLTAVQLERLTLSSVRTGTQLELSAAVDPAASGEMRLHAMASAEGDGAGPEGEMDLPIVRASGGQGVALQGVWTQDLEALDGAPEAFVGRGRLRIPFSLESPSQTYYRLHASLELEEASVTLPVDGLVLRGMNGRLMMDEELRLTASGGVELLPFSRQNPFVRASFSEAQPFLGQDSYLSIEEGQLMGTPFGPVAANIRLDHNVLRLDQLQMNLLEGAVTGQVLLEYRPGDSRIALRGNGTGLRVSSAREPLDANLALDLAWDKQELNGRAHLVRIGRQTLLELLDVADPYRQDVSINQARQALAFGYPKFVRCTFDHGFMGLKIELGGAAAGVRLSEIRGLAMGPLLNKYLGEASVDAGTGLESSPTLEASP